ncbi:predicted protein [Histoplasma capsulatum G186AR]|uniref:Uncharacterized protein n=2 Tax=Ajellomyces capsulatus TaxID=5037 RepID=C0NM77_AJECG|nr:uncharacterized protein HCBG_04607 [Histoplasma capsulatum G186AR]EEH07728.1 predicted protein [Histoplasma capsulatum G186AR]KAG5304129.1 hypothetical protein I7I52_02360 [Histoplasma capsulatum]QSS69727.1 hypothetical protein I7I50_11121 [Histoplasma capsulatum G186AR]
MSSLQNTNWCDKHTTLESIIQILKSTCWTLGKVDRAPNGPLSIRSCALLIGIQWPGKESSNFRSDATCGMVLRRIAQHHSSSDTQGSKTSPRNANTFRLDHLENLREPGLRAHTTVTPLLFVLLPLPVVQIH